MKIFASTFVLVIALGAAASAAGTDYDDPGMHYAPPAGWEKITLAPAPDADPGGGPGGGDDQRPPAPVYAYHRGQSDQRTIVIDIQNFAGTLDAFERQHESDIRKGSDNTFVDKPTKTALANGMPVYLLKVNAGSDVGHFIERYEYLMIDGARSIDVSYSGRQGDFDRKSALDAFSSLYVVAYPRQRP